MRLRSTLPTHGLLFLLLFYSPLLQSQSLLQSGPMVGYGQMTEVMLWVQTAKPASVQFRYWETDRPKEKKLSRSVKTADDRALTAHVLIDGLQPGKKFEYELLIDGKVTTRPYPLRFQTQPLWHWRTDPPDFTVAIGSCFYVNEAQWDRPGRPYGSNYEILTTIAGMNPDLMIWLGDNTYYREVDWHSVAGLRHRWTHTRSLPELQPLLGSTHHYATWDDHDYGPNDSDRGYRLKGAALETHKLFWGNQTYGTPEVPGVFGRFEWGDVEFFLLDDRYHRAPNDAPDNEEKTMWGRDQRQWLMDGLTSSIATFKVVANGSQVLNPHAAGKEALKVFRHEYDLLLNFVREQNISGVFFITGDRHYTELIRLDGGPHPLYDFTSSSLTAGLSAPRSEEEKNNSARVEGTLVTDAHNFGMMRFSGPRTDRKVVLECWDYTGKLRWQYEIKASDLQRAR
jgi:alkaline phosphatase D